MCKTVSDSYYDLDKERKFFDHTLELNSRELNERNRDIKKVLSLLAEAQRISHTGSWYLDLQNQDLEWSNEIYSIVDLPIKSSSPSREYFKSLIHPEDKEIADSSFSITLKNHRFDNSYRLKLKSGQIKYIHEQREVILNNSGRPISIQGTIQDVTTGKIAENELRLYANVFHNSGESIMITDKNNTIIAVNNAFTKTTGYAMDELKGKNPGVLSAGNTNIETYKKMWADLNKHGFWSGELNDRKKNGETFPKMISISSCYNEAGEVTNYIANFSDITESKKSQEHFHFLAHHDALTSLLNRFSLEERLNQAMHIANRDKNQIAVLYIDMDRFKTINDSLGHHAGDQLLIEVAKRLNYSVRESDIVARVGGDEFIVCL
ncbi:MAG: diguanylate cyclase, partial [Gammaproteobacteria bacterium]|nr:diguanylate cyclase [Gammaproteobacteria bacterium]